MDLINLGTTCMQAVRWWHLVTPSRAAQLIEFLITIMDATIT